MTIQIHSLYNRQDTLSSAVTFSDPTLTQQHFRQECDINFIMDRYNRTGMLPQNANISEAFYGDVSDSFDYRSSLEAIQAADEAFASLPAAVRQRFANDPSQLIDFLHDSGNRAEAISLGLISPDPDPTSGPAPASDDGVSSAKSSG